MFISIFLMASFCVNDSFGVTILSTTVQINSSTPKPKETKVKCGMDLMQNDTLHEGLTEIEKFPWLGLLIYPIDNPRPTTTTLVLITRQVAVTTALDIDYYPKDDFRARSRVIMGNNCSGPYIRILDYSFYPDFAQSTYSSLALVQLDTKKMWISLYHICPPPEELNNPVQVYAMVLVNDCYNSSMVMVYKMEYVDQVDCREFYRKAELYMESMRPTHVACAKGFRGGHCIWRSGTALVVQQGGLWRLLGVGTYGPGCESPARFLDYSMYRQWVQRSLSKIGQPTITRISPGYIVLRRTMNNIPRYGECDTEETKKEIFSDISTIVPPPYYDSAKDLEPVKYNITLLEHVEYHCITLRASNIVGMDSKLRPQIKIRRWCTKRQPFCTEYAPIKAYFYVEINLREPCYFKVNAYGLDIEYVNERRVMQFIKKWEPRSHNSLYKSER